MSRVRSILFNGEMVRAILDDRKTVTRRLIKPQPKMRLCYGFAGSDPGKWRYPSESAWKFWGEQYKKSHLITEKDSEMLWNPPCQTGDILYVREAWCNVNTKDYPSYFYLADNDRPKDFNMVSWHPSIHMPKEAARIWLKVTDVRVERLQEITIGGCQEEGCWCGHNGDIFAFMALWDSTIKKPGIAQYGWNANPWVWVIEFERCDRPEGWMK